MSQDQRVFRLLLMSAVAGGVLWAAVCWGQSVSVSGERGLYG